MAKDAYTARARAWNTQYTKYLTLTQKLEQAQAQERDALERAIAAQQDELLQMDAPNLLALMHKLEIIWEGELEGLDQASQEKVSVIADLSDLLAEARDLIGATDPRFA